MSHSARNPSSLATATPILRHKPVENKDALYPPEVAEQLDAVVALNGFDTALQRLVESVQRFAPPEEAAKELLAMDAEMARVGARLEQHRQQGVEIARLTGELNKVDTGAKKLLQEAVACRKLLQLLPKLEDSSTTKVNGVSVDDLLTYAMKLAKFTTAPPTFATGTVGPADFVWPAENMLRRGVLAMASLKGDDLIKVGTEHEREQSPTMAPAPSAPTSPQLPSAATADAAPQLDLDLFDPDEEM